jgi:hypothetical protein
MARSHTVRHATVRQRFGAGGVASLAGLTAAVGLAAGAHAASPSPTPNPSDVPTAGTSSPSTTPSTTTPTPTATATGPARKVAADPTVTPTVTETVAPDYGFQKVRVGVQIASGAYVPAGTTTAGTVLTVTETGPDAPDPNVTTCTTAAPVPAVAGSTATYCSFTEDDLARAAQTYARAHGRAAGDVLEADYTADPGDTVSVTQNTVEPGLVTDATGVSVGPCLAADESPVCADEAQAVLTDPGIPPTAADDVAATPLDTAVDINVLSNDTTAGAPPLLTVLTQPGDGTAVVSGEQTAARTRASRVTSGLSVLYTPKTGFVGRDTFTYRLSTANGSATALVTVTVTAPPPSAVNDTAATTTDSSATIAVLDNDNAHGGGALVITGVGTPSHGTARIDGDDIVYTPAAGYVGIDQFPYSIKTAFGTATAEVTVTITAPVAPSTPVTTETVLPFTGLPAEGLVELAGGLLLAGGAARLVRRRRKP